jgi:predicted nucleotide-binding protein
MTKKKLPVTGELIKPLTEFNTMLDNRIVIGEEIFSRTVANQENFVQPRKDFSNWSEYNSEYLKHAFNKEYNEYKKRYDDAGNPNFMFIGGTKDTPAQELKDFKYKITSKLDNLKKLRLKSELLKTNIVEVVAEFQIVKKLNRSDIFIVHGHDEEAKAKTARFITTLGFNPIILHEQVSSSKTVIEKIEKYTDVGFGIILYTPCDIGAKNEEKPNYQNRARQNVVFEHGFLIGKIGRENVCALVKSDVETPNDISGVVYVKMDNDDAWQIKIAKEIRKSGYNVDLNKL